MVEFLNRLAKDASGATALEYVLIGTLIGIGVAAAAAALFSGTEGIYVTNASKILAAFGF